MKMLSRKGQVSLAGPLGATVGVVFSLFFIGILIFAFALAGGSMADSTTDTTAESIINSTIEGAQSFADFSPTLWIMAAVGALLAILIGAVGVFFLVGSRN